MEKVPEVSAPVITREAAGVGFSRRLVIVAGLAFAGVTGLASSSNAEAEPQPAADAYLETGGEVCEKVEDPGGTTYTMPDLPGEETLLVIKAGSDQSTEDPTLEIENPEPGVTYGPIIGDNGEAKEISHIVQCYEEGEETTTTAAATTTTAAETTTTAAATTTTEAATTTTAAETTTTAAATTSTEAATTTTELETTTTAASTTTLLTGGGYNTRPGQECYDGPEGNPEISITVTKSRSPGEIQENSVVYGFFRGNEAGNRIGQQPVTPEQLEDGTETYFIQAEDGVGSYYVVAQLNADINNDGDVEQTNTQYELEIEDCPSETSTTTTTLPAGSSTTTTVAGSTTTTIAGGPTTTTAESTTTTTEPATTTTAVITPETPKMPEVGPLPATK